MDKRYAPTVPLRERHPLIQWAEEKGVMLKDVCGDLGISRPTLHHWDKGHCLPSAPFMSKIMDYTAGAVTPNALHAHWKSKQTQEAA
jgi:hypothetical protein